MKQNHIGFFSFFQVCLLLTETKKPENNKHHRCSIECDNGMCLPHYARQFSFLCVDVSNSCGRFRPGHCLSARRKSFNIMEWKLAQCSFLFVRKLAAHLALTVIEKSCWCCLIDPVLKHKKNNLIYFKHSWFYEEDSASLISRIFAFLGRKNVKNILLLTILLATCKHSYAL